MISRYSRDEMVRIWTEEYKFGKMLDIEILVCEILCLKGKIPKKALKNIKSKAKFDIKRIKKIEETTKHDVIAFLTAVAENVGPDSRFIHLGLTSSDVLDTTFAVQLRDSINIIRKDIKNVISVLKQKAKKYKNIPMIGRTHGIHAEPITFGLKLALWYTEMQTNLERLNDMESRVCYGKLSGAVGTYSNLDPYVEDYVCKKLKIKAAPVATQVVGRERHAEYLTTLSIIAGSLEKFATELRNLQRTDILEVEECFTKGQKGSSAMPHKKNPISSETITGLSRIVRSNTIAGLENIALWHERDISHSSTERIIFPDTSILINYMLNRFKNVLSNLVIHKENMKANLLKTGGLFSSQRLMLTLIDKGITREKAYVLVQRNSMKSWENKIPLRELVLQDKNIMKLLNKKEVLDALDIGYFLRNIDKIYKRIKLL